MLFDEKPLIIYSTCLATLGQDQCSKNAQGIFLTLEKSASSLLNESPLAHYIRPIENEPVRLAMLMSLGGGMQNEIVNIGEVKRFLYSSDSLLPKLKNVFVEANAIMPEGRTVLKNSLEMMLQLKVSINEVEKVLAGDRINVSRALTLLNRIDSKVKYFKSITDVVREHCLSSSVKPAYAELLQTIDEIQDKFPKRFRVNLGGEKVKKTFNGISIYFRGSLCMGKLCFKDLSTTVDYLAENNCFSDTRYVSMFRAKGKVLRAMALSQGDILTLPMGHVIELFFPRNSDIVSTHFVGESFLFAVNQHVNVTLDKRQLTFQTQGNILDKYMTNMNVVAKTSHVQDWSSLIFKVDGRMTNSSLLSQFLQNQVSNFANFLAQGATKRVERCEESILSAEQRLHSAKQLVKVKQTIFDRALREKQRKLSKFQRIRAAYGKTSVELKSSLDQFLKVKNRKLCQLLSCNYIDTDTCIPALCQEKIFVNYTVPLCRKVKEKRQVEVVVSKVVEEVEMVQTHIVEHRSSCGKTVKFLTGIGEGMTVAGGIASYVSHTIGGILSVVGVVFNGLGGIIDSITGCNNYRVKVRGPKVPVIHKVTKSFREYRTEEIDRYICDAQKTETVISGYRPYECCKNENGKKIKVLDPKCVSHNRECSIKMTILAEEIQFENETFFGEFQDMMKKGKQATDAQLEANKAEIKFDVAAKQLQLARARFKQHESSREAINLPRVKLSEELGLKLGQNMKKLEGKALVFVDSLEFSVSITKSSTKTRFPLTAYVRTFEGSHKKIQFSMDFKQEDNSLALASKFIVETLFGTSHSRRRRSVRDELIMSKNDSAFPLERHECLFSKEAHILFADIIESMDFAIISKRKLKEAMSTSIRGLQKIPVENDNDGNTSYSDIIQFLKDVQINSSGAISWNDTLNDVRGFLDVLTQKKNFTDCSGIQDCADFFFDSLEEMYGMEYHPRAIEIKVALQSLNKIISSILRENLTISMLEGKLSQARFLINNSNDEIILCGKKPTIERNSPVEVVTLHGGAVHLVCEAKSTLEVEYKWIKNGQPLEGANSTILELRNITENSEGAYKCQASNKRGSTVSNVTIVIVHQRPQITEQPLDAQKLVGDETFWMVCNSTGVPQPLTEWFFIPIAIKGKNQDAVRLDTTGPVLQMRNMTTTNSGFYYCNVSNFHGAVQSRMARLDVLRFFPGVPRIALSLKLKQCMSVSSPKNTGPYYCNRTTTEKSQEIGAAAYQYIILKMLEHMSWPVEKTDSEHYKPFPDAAISFVLNGGDPSVAEGKKLEALKEFSLSRRRIGNSLKKLYSSLEDGEEKIKWKNLTISGDKDSLVVGFPPQKCPNGTRRHENGFLCGKVNIPCYYIVKLNFKFSSNKR